MLDSIWDMLAIVGLGGLIVGGIILIAFWKVLSASFITTCFDFIGGCNPWLKQTVRRQRSGNARWSEQASQQYLPASYKNRHRHTLPFEGPWQAVNGGGDEATSHSWEIKSQRYAYDFIFDDPGYSPDPFQHYRLDSFPSLGREILATCDGVVVETADDARDLLWPDPMTARTNPFIKDIRGNYVVIDYGEGEFGLYAHLKRGSVCVVPGELVKHGQVIGCCGNSGNTTEPHLHFQLQTSQDFYEAHGLPVRFSQVMVLDPAAAEFAWKKVTNLLPVRGMILKAVEKDAGAPGARAKLGRTVT